MLQNSYVTKDQLRTEFEKFEKKIEAKFDQIIAAVAKGFEETASKNDLKLTETRLEKRIEKVENRLSRVESGISEIKRNVNDLKADTITDPQFNNHERRIVKLEKKAFLQAAA